MEESKCLCGREATHIAYLPTNIWAGLRQMTEPTPVCSYHAEKARKAGYVVETK